MRPLSILMPGECLFFVHLCSRVNRIYKSFPNHIPLSANPTKWSAYSNNS